MKRIENGSILVVCLLFISLLLILGIGFLASRAGEYRGARQAIRSLEARGLAMAGLEETRLKLLKDFNFPPIAAVDQPAYEVVETVYDLDGTTEVGTYQVTVHTDRVGPPYYIMMIDSVGKLGSSLEPLARRRLRATVDLREEIGGTPNADYFKIVGVKDYGEI